MISSALTHGERQKSFAQKKLTDVTDTLYKRALIRESESRSEIARINTQKQLTDAMRTSPVKVMGLGKVSFDQWKSLPSETREYSYYAFTENQRGEEPLSFNEWDQQTTDPVKKQYFDLGKEDPEFAEWLKENTKAGATRISIGEKVETAEALLDVKSKKYFTDPKGGLASDIDKHLESEDVQNRLIQFFDADDPTKLEREKIRAKESFTVGKIKAAGGKIIESKLDGRDFVWTVEWPDGKTSEVRVGN